MQTITKLFILLATTIATVQAHPGHDHASETSAVFHLFFYGALVVVALAATVAFRSKKSKGE